MFTGIIQEIGTVRSCSPSGGNIRITIDAPGTVPDLRPGASVAVNGICLTAVDLGGTAFTAEVVEETLTKTALGDQVGRGRVNLELPMRADGRFDGHIVLGHVDTTGTVASIEERDESWWFSIGIPDDFLRYVVHTGSIAIDGVSLTVAGLKGNLCRISIIPHTMDNTIFRHYGKGDRVNVEVDVIGKYVERILRSGGGVNPPKLTVEGLRKQGF